MLESIKGMRILVSVIKVVTRKLIKLLQSRKQVSLIISGGKKIANGQGMVYEKCKNPSALSAVVFSAFRLVSLGLFLG